MSQPRLGDPLPLGGGKLPYSKGVMARALIAGGVPADGAYQLARAVEIELAERRVRALEVDRLQALACEILGREPGERAVRRLRRLSDLKGLDRPLIILIGGSTGTGKSTVASEVAYRLGITRVTSTDFIRQTMRAFLPGDSMPTIHYSSFEAGAALDGDAGPDPVVAGFLDQCRHVCVGVDAAIRRALTEGWSMVLEGVHLVPGMVPSALPGALLLHVVVEIANEDAHRMHFHLRDSTTGGIRPMEKYLDRLGDIRRIQSCIVDLARRNGVEVVENANVERSIDRVIGLLMDMAESAAAPA